MHRYPQHPFSTAADPPVGPSPSAGAEQGESADDAGGRRRARHGRRVRAAAVVGAGAAGATHTGRWRPGVGGECGGAAAARHRAASARRLPAGVLRRAVGRRRWQRLRHPQRCARGVADRRRARPGAAVPGGVGDVARSLHRPRGGLRARTGHQRGGPDRPRGRARRRLAQGRRGVAGSPGAAVRQRPGQPRADGRGDQPGQERLGRSRLDATEPRLPLRVRRPAGLGQGGLRPRRHQRGVRRAHRGAGPLPALRGQRSDVVGGGG